MKWFKCDFFIVALEQVTFLSKGTQDGKLVMFVYLRDGQVKQTIYNDTEMLDRDYMALAEALSKNETTYECEHFVVVLKSLINVGRTTLIEGSKDGIPALYLDFEGGRSSQTNFDSFERVDLIFQELGKSLEGLHEFSGKVVR
jgi:hypothetical protein